MKQCFTCKRKKPLIFYKKNRMKYQLKSDHGRVVECRLCTVKRFIKRQGKIVKYNFDTKKFELLTMKVNLINILKQYL